MLTDVFPRHQNRVRPADLKLPFFGALVFTIPKPWIRVVIVFLRI